jgi:hypothetical protein
MEENIKIPTEKKTPVPKKKQTPAVKQQPKEGTLKAIMGQFVDRMAEAVDNGEYTLKRREFKLNNDPNWMPCTLIIDGLEIECSLNKDGYMTWHPHMSLESAITKLLNNAFKGKREKKLSMEAEELD